MEEFQDAFKRDGIEIPSPVQDMRLRGPVQVVGNDYPEK